ncbi:hypothetical protein [Duffyella gerundensis]|uniref:hypothetical protein n=1 Tax=Duffyella gerundensis TaxID=1619313 RepID=UPI0021F77D7F|nr:hypothetical protein [Duffyella gerundensis]
MTKPPKQNEESLEHIEKYKEYPICGIIMPIADSNGYPTGHWQDVYSILKESAINAGFNPNLVSFDNDIGVIQKRIIQNIYSNPIVICDISSKNANVMFELGMRLAFDKPTIIVKDEDTSYSFDISSIEHLNYPSDLRYKSINDFKEKLSEKIKSTYNKSLEDPNYSTFLRSYGTFEVVDIKEVEVTESKYILSQINEIKSLLTKNSLTPTLKKPINDDGYTSRLYRIKIGAAGNKYLDDPNHLIELLREYNIRLNFIHVRET